MAKIVSPLGSTIPFQTPHAVSVSLPKWQDNVDYEEAHPRIASSMSSGYPRFYIHHIIQKLAKLIESTFGAEGELALLLPSRQTAESCVDFLQVRSCTSRIVHIPVPRPDRLQLHAVFAAEKDFGVLKQFWQHTGDGISSRFAEFCLARLTEKSSGTPTDELANGLEGAHLAENGAKKEAAHLPSKNRYYTPKVLSPTLSPTLGSPTLPSTPLTDLSSSVELAKPASKRDRYATAKNMLVKREGSTSSASGVSSLQQSTSSLTSSVNGNGVSHSDDTSDEEVPDDDFLETYVEERYGRNLSTSFAPLAKSAMRRRIAGVLGEGQEEDLSDSMLARKTGEESNRGVDNLGESDVWLYPCGMSAIFHAHMLVLQTLPKVQRKHGKSVCFGFPYTDTLKILEKWGPGAHFLGKGLSSDLPALRALLEDEKAAGTPIQALFTEFPSNPLLRSPPLLELRKLADEFGFLIVVDETIAGFVNIETLPHVDIVVSSLTKVFSGDSNVMGGSLVLNPRSKYYKELKEEQEAVYEDFYFDKDALYMERNSRDFQHRVEIINRNAERVCDFLRSVRDADSPFAEGIDPLPAPTLKRSVIKEVYYPKFMTRPQYDGLKRKAPPSNPFQTGYGSLFSLTFTSGLAARKFFDALDCYKGPSLGTNFTLACPYTILAHYGELSWAKGWGVDAELIRVSIGLEDEEQLFGWFKHAIEVAQKAVEDALS